MQPRTVKGPSWANEQQLRSQPTGKKEKGAGIKDDQMDVDPAPSQDALSDLEWMRQRMAKSVVGDPNTVTHISDPPPKNNVEAHQVRPREVIPVYSVSPNVTLKAGSLFKRSNTGHHSPNRSALRPEPCLLLRGRGSGGAIQTFWRNFTGRILIPETSVRSPSSC